MKTGTFNIATRDGIKEIEYLNKWIYKGVTLVLHETFLSTTIRKNYQVSEYFSGHKIYSFENTNKAKLKKEVKDLLDRIKDPIKTIDKRPKINK